MATTKHSNDTNGYLAEEDGRKDFPPHSESLFPVIRAGQFSAEFRVFTLIGKLLAAIEQWVFARPLRGGQPVDVKVNIPVDFPPPAD